MDGIDIKNLYVINVMKQRCTYKSVFTLMLILSSLFSFISTIIVIVYPTLLARVFIFVYPNQTLGLKTNYLKFNYMYPI